MDEQSKGFRGVVFGGFKREDVLRYIEEHRYQVLFGNRGASPAAGGGAGRDGGVARAN